MLEGDTYFVGGRYLFRRRELIISREGDNYFAEEIYLFRVRDLLFRGRGVIFRGREILISRVGDNYFAGGTYYFAGGRLLFRGRDLLFRGREIILFCNLSFQSHRTIARACLAHIHPIANQWIHTTVQYDHPIVADIMETFQTMFMVLLA